MMASIVVFNPAGNPDLLDHAMREMELLIVDHGMSHS